MKSKIQTKGTTKTGPASKTKTNNTPIEPAKGKVAPTTKTGTDSASKTQKKR